MARSRRSAVQRYHDRVADRYDRTYDDAFWQWHDALTWGYLKPFLPSNARARVADLGCGTGKWGARLAKCGNDVTCVDISAKMLDQARRKFDETGRVATFVQADVCDLSPLPAGSFSLAVAFGEPIGCAESPAQALKEIRRILADDGILVATFDNRLAAIDFYLQGGDSAALARFLRDGRTHWLTKERDERFPIHTFTPAGIERLARDCGFELVDIVGKTVLPMRHNRHLLETPEARRTWARIERGLARDQAAIGRAAHLQAACRVAHP